MARGCTSLTPVGLTAAWPWYGITGYRTSVSLPLHCCLPRSHMGFGSCPMTGPATGVLRRRRAETWLPPPQTPPHRVPPGAQHRQEIALVKITTCNTYRAQMTRGDVSARIIRRLLRAPRLSSTPSSAQIFRPRVTRLSSRASGHLCADPAAWASRQRASRGAMEPRCIRRVRPAPHEGGCRTR
jgi:hypothetical protein